MMIPPDKSYGTAEAAEILERSERQVLRYLVSGRLMGSKSTGQWQVTELQIWQFRGIAEDMLANWRAYCREIEVSQVGDDTPETHSDETQ